MKNVFECWQKIKKHMSTPKFLRDIVIDDCGHGSHKLCRVFTGNSVAVLSGSALLKDLTSGSWSTGDIDFFVADASNTLKRLGLRLYSRFVTRTGGAGYAKSMNGISRIYTLKTRGRKIQFIELADCKTHDDIVSHIFKEFDMDICKNAFWTTEGRGHLRTYLSLDVLKSKKSMLQFKDTPAFIERIEKYESRGFTFVNKKDILEKLKVKNNVVTVSVRKSDAIPSLKQYLIHDVEMDENAKKLFARVVCDDVNYLYPCRSPTWVPKNSIYCENVLYKIVHDGTTFLFHESVEEDVDELDIGDCRIDDDSESSESDSEPPRRMKGKKLPVEDSESSDSEQPVEKRHESDSESSDSEPNDYVQYSALKKRTGKISRKGYLRLKNDILNDMNLAKISPVKASQMLENLASHYF